MSPESSHEWSVAVVCVQVHGARHSWNKLYFVPLVRFFKDCETVAPVLMEVERTCNVENFGKGLTAISKLGLGVRFRDLEAALDNFKKESSPVFPSLQELLQVSLDLCAKVKEMPSLWAQTLLREQGVNALASLEASARASVPSSADIYVRGSEVLTKYNKEWMESDSKVELVLSSAKILTLGFTQVEGLCSFELSEFFPSAPAVMKVLSRKLNSLCQDVVKQLSDKMDEMRQVPVSKWQPVLDAARGPDCNFEQVHADLWVNVETVQQCMEKLSAGQLHGRKPRLMYGRIFLMVCFLRCDVMCLIFIIFH